MREEWAKIEEFPNYSVSSEGRVRNDAHRRIVKLSMTVRGGVKVGLYKDGEGTSRSVTLLVADAFVDGKSDTFDTPINLDGDLFNNHMENIAWRPLWFAVRYKKQFKDIERYRQYGPVVDRHNGLVYESIVDASTTNGILLYDLQKSLVTKTPVFPTWHAFVWKKELERDKYKNG